MPRKDLRQLVLERQFLLRQIDAWKNRRTATVTFQSELKRRSVTFTDLSAAQLHLGELEQTLASGAGFGVKPEPRRRVA